MVSVFRKSKFKRSYEFHEGLGPIPSHVFVKDERILHVEFISTSEGFKELDEDENVELDGIIYNIDAKAAIEGGFSYYVSAVGTEPEIVSDDRESLITAQEGFINDLLKKRNLRDIIAVEELGSIKKSFFDRFRR
jgi:hypothetical protein